MLVFFRILVVCVSKALHKESDPYDLMYRWWVVNPLIYDIHNPPLELARLCFKGEKHKD
jgi:hypothetical protein